MKLLKTLTLLLLTSQLGFTQEMETFCDDFSSDLWEGLEGDTVGYSTEGTEPILGSEAYFILETGYGFGSITFNFNGAEQIAVIDFMDTWGWGETHDITINGSTFVSLGESFPMDIDGFTINLTRDTLPSGAIDIELTVEGLLTAITLEGLESWVYNLCVTRPINPSFTASLDTHEMDKLELYPNPAANKIQLQTEGKLKGYSIHTISGKLVDSQSFNSVTEKQISVLNLEPGIYLINVKKADNTSETLRFSKN